MSIPELKEQIEKFVPQARVYILDPMNDGQHLQAIVISPVFEGMPLLKQHQMILGPLKDVLQSKVHALGLKTFTPAKWENVKKDYQV